MTKTQELLMSQIDGAANHCRHAASMKDMRDAAEMLLTRVSELLRTLPAIEPEAAIDLDETTGV